jgi:hypothetical protein
VSSASDHFCFMRRLIFEEKSTEAHLNTSILLDACFSGVVIHVSLDFSKCRIVPAFQKTPGIFLTLPLPPTPGSRAACAATPVAPSSTRRWSRRFPASPARSPTRAGPDLRRPASRIRRPDSLPVAPRSHARPSRRSPEERPPPRAPDERPPPFPGRQAAASPMKQGRLWAQRWPQNLAVEKQAC